MDGGGNGNRANLMHNIEIMKQQRCNVESSLESYLENNQYT